MINWMQKHKKYLIPTIWVSTIAFVGAGFVGWGQFDMNRDRSTSVAKVGDMTVSYQEFQQKYNNLYNYYNNILEGKMTQEEADKLHLDQVALVTAIREAMKLNYAKDLGIGASDEDILKHLIGLPEFQRDGKFDKDLYISSLQRVGMKPADFEKSLKNNVILNKLDSALDLTASKKDIDALSAAFFMQDRLSLGVIKMDFSDINATSDEIKKFWEDTKDDYKTVTSYELETLFISPDVTIDSAALMDFWEKHKTSYIDSNDKVKEFEAAKEEAAKDFKLELTKTTALKKYLALKKGEISTNDKLTVSQNDEFPLDEIQHQKVGEFIKPFEYKDGYLIVKIDKVNPPKTMTFEQAQSQVKEIFKGVKAKDELEKLAKKALENFSGEDIGYVSRDTRMSYKDLNENEFSQFLSQLFDRSSSNKGYIIVGNKAVLYDITDQKLDNPEKEEQFKTVLSQEVANIKNTELEQDLLNSLEKRYKIEQYYKGNNIE
ncbi:peptidylprolyl isomerase [Campylobacter geochelonis]|uniref:Glutamate-1-semialdehyde 2,1-aminomutase n=1 Tax=Campylobacter geochelonis TaxID=1780362 RepID=A0A128EH76_9BACT|nr:peptidylprolyl isomerase [Campylobacter geochelonis]QKF71522.1 putative periplasmic folding chaperone [Campylobacter geochelonis]CZE47931.1 glutamate-1-semialdehyde 2%2C1-aminomutase [Campylobacter geochelonis]CZE48479.1 glutamate-1-semialdehyde 2%2C1-aminomutase [Campylobacter geochelonis]